MIEAIYTYLNGINANRLSTKFDSHKKDELQTLYTNIIKINTATPFYLIKPTIENQVFALDMKESSLHLQTAISFMVDNAPDSIFETKQAAIKDSSAATAEIITDEYNKLPPPFNLHVTSLASIQKNKSFDCYTNGIGPKEGTYTFRIIKDNSPHEFQIDISERLKHGQIMQKIVAAINNRPRLDLSAQIEAGEKENTSHISISSNETGLKENTDCSFYLKDINFPENQVGLVDYFNLNQVATPASNAHFMIDNEKKETLSNEFTLNNSLRVTLNETTDTPIKVGYIPDSNKIISSVNDFLNGYNGLLDLIHSNTVNHGSAIRIQTQLKSLTSTYKNELESCGISRIENGYLTLDHSIAEQAIISGDMQQFFTTSPFITDLMKKSYEINLNPFEFVEKRIVNYPNTAKQIFPSPYLTSIYTGMYFSLYC